MRVEIDLSLSTLGILRFNSLLFLAEYHTDHKITEYYYYPRYITVYIDSISLPTELPNIRMI